jgi:hypothetical protein
VSDSRELDSHELGRRDGSWFVDCEFERSDSNRREFIRRVSDRRELDSRELGRRDSSWFVDCEFERSDPNRREPYNRELARSDSRGLGGREPDRREPRYEPYSREVGNHEPDRLKIVTDPDPLIPSPSRGIGRQRFSLPL